MDRRLHGCMWPTGTAMGSVAAGRVGMLAALATVAVVVLAGWMVSVQMTVAGKDGQETAWLTVVERDGQETAWMTSVYMWPTGTAVAAGRVGMLAAVAVVVLAGWMVSAQMTEAADNRS